MVIGKIGSLATTILVIGLGFLFLKQAYGSSIGQAGMDVGTGLSSTATGISNVISAFITPITGIFGAISGLLGNFGSNGSRNEPSIQGRDERRTPTQMVRTGDTSTISWASGTTATVPSLSSEARAYYSALGVKTT